MRAAIRGGPLCATLLDIHSMYSMRIFALLTLAAPQLSPLPVARACINHSEQLP